MTDDERWQGIAIYGLYLVALFTGVPFLIGVILAYVFRGNAAPAIATHFEHQIGLFWRVFFGGIVACILFWVGLILTATAILAVLGIPMMIAGGLITLWTFLLIIFRCIRGIGNLNAAEPYHGPTGWAL